MLKRTMKCTLKRTIALFMAFSMLAGNFTMNASAMQMQDGIQLTANEEYPNDLRMLFYGNLDEFRVWDESLGYLSESQNNSIKQYIEKNIVSASDSDYEKAHKIYNWIYGNLTYASGIGVTPYLDPYDVFTYKTAVCGGFSNLYKAMLNAVGIPSVLVSGNTPYGAHIWNAVYADGRWFYSDATWGNDYFDKGTDAFLQDHVIVRVESVAIDAGNGVLIGYDNGIAVVGVSEGITTVNVPDMFYDLPVTAISYRLYNAQYGMKELNIGANVNAVETQAVCATLESITVSDKNTTYAARDGVLFSKDLSRIWIYPAKKTSPAFMLPKETVIFDTKDSFTNSYLQNIEVEKGNPDYTSYKGALYTADKKTLLAVPAAMKEVHVYKDAVIDDVALANVWDWSQITIYGESGSAAQSFAEYRDIPFVVEQRKNQADANAVYTAVKEELEAVDYLNSTTIQKMLGPSRYTSTEKLNKQTEMFKTGNYNSYAEITEDMVIAELNKDNLEMISLKNAFKEVQNDLADLIPQIVENSYAGYGYDDTQDFIDTISLNKEKFLLGITYLYRLYDFEIGNINIKNKILEDPSYFGRDCDLMTWLITLGGSGGDSLKLANNASTFQRYFSGTVTNSTSVIAFLENEIAKNPGLTPNVWFKEASDALILEEPSKEMPNATYALYEKLKSNSTYANYILPLLNVSENSMYVVSNVSTITLGPIDTYVDRTLKTSDPSAYQTELKSFTDALKNNSEAQAAFLDVWYRIAKPDKQGSIPANRRVIDGLRVKNGNNGYASIEWSVKFGDKAAAGVSEFFTPMNLYGAYVGANAQAEGNDVRYFMQKAISEDGLCTYSHELTHLLCENVFLGGFTYREGLEGEFFPRGLYESFWDKSYENTDPIMNLNFIYDYEGYTDRVYNKSPERFQNTDDLQEFMQGAMDVLYTLDYMEAEVVLSKSTAEKVQWYHKMVQTADTRTRFNQGNANATHTVDTIVEITDTEAASLSKIEDLIDNNIVASRHEIEGTKTTGTAASNGYHTVPLFTANYAVGENTNGVSGDVITRKQAHELLAEYGYYEGMVPYISNQYLSDAAAAGKVLSDEFIFDQLFGSDYADMKAFKKAMFQRRADAMSRLKPITITYDGSVMQITSADQIRNLMAQAVAYDLNNVYITSNGWPNIRAKYTKVETLKRAVYSAYLTATDDFQTSIYRDENDPIETPTPTPTATPTPTSTPTVVPTATPTPADDSLYTEDFPFEFPKELNKTVVLEAERMHLTNVGNEPQWYIQVASNSWASGGKYVDSMNNGDTAKLYYVAEKAGTYQVVLTLRSGDTRNGLIWQEANGKITANTASNIGANDEARETHTATFTFVVEKAGTGVITFTAPQYNAPQMDKFEITAIEFEAEPTPSPTVTPTPVITVTPTPTPSPTVTVIPGNPADDSRDIPLDVLTATAGDEQALSGSNTSEGPADFVLDGDENTKWHTNWNGQSDRDKHWIQFEVEEGYEVDGLRYLPRTDAGGANAFGVITSYRILVSNDGSAWREVDAGTWGNNADWKLAVFDAEEVKYVRLMSDDSISDSRLFSSAAEIRLTGSKVQPLSGYENIADEAEITTTGIEHDTDKSHLLIDENYGTLYKFHNAVMSEEKEIVLTYHDIRKIDAFRIVFEKVNGTDGYEFNYSILAMKSDGTYDTIADHITANRTDNYKQEYSITETEYLGVKIVMHSCKNGSANAWPAIAEFEVYGKELVFDGTFDRIVDMTIEAGETVTLPGILTSSPTKTGIVYANVPAYVEVSGNREAAYPIPSGKYLITNSSYMLINGTNGSNPTGLGMQSVDYTSDDLAKYLWTIKQDDGGYLIQDAQGKYMNFTNANGYQCDVTFGENPQVLQILKSNGSGYGISDGTYYINNFDNNNDKAAGWYDNNNNWYFYQAEEKVEITGLVEGVTQVVIGRTAYNITVESKSIVVDFGLPVEYVFDSDKQFVSISDLTAAYGTVSVTSNDNGNGKFTNTVTYTPTKVMKDMDIISLNTTDGNTVQIKVYPATTVYYEEGFMTYEGSWKDTGSIGTGKQELQLLSEDDSAAHYGYDIKYAEETAGPSNGSEAVSETAGNMASFTFVGNGVDIYANCSPETGNITILVRDEENQIKKLLIMSTAMGAGTSEKTALQAVDANGMRVLSLNNLEHGTYTVKIQHNTNRVTDPNTGLSTGMSKPFMLDGFRVYNTLSDSSVFDVHDEANPNFVEMRNTVLDSLTVSDVIPTVTPEIKPYDLTILAKNATASSEQNPPGWTNDGYASWAFDEEEHWWHTKYSIEGGDGATNTNEGLVTDTQSHWIQTGFDKVWYLDHITYVSRGQNMNCFDEYKVYAANMENPTDKPTEDDFVLVKEGNLENLSTEQTIKLDEAVAATHVRIEVLSVHLGEGKAYVAAKQIQMYGYDVPSIYAEDIASGLSQVYDKLDADGTVILSAGMNESTSYTKEEVKDLLDNGPKNEIFLYEGQTLVFKLAAGLENVQLGMKTVNAPVTADVNGKEQTIQSSTDMFYYLGDVGDTDKVISITNKSDGNDDTNSILSITDLKYFDTINENVTVFRQLTASDFMTCALNAGFEKTPEESSEDVAENPFTDIDENDFYYDAVLWALQKDITAGVSADSFAPMIGCSRAEIVTFLWRTAGRPEPKKNECTFEDVEEGTYYYDAVLWATEEGITKGFDDKTFGTNATCTRAQMVTFLWRAEGEPKNNHAVCAFEDVTEDAYYYNAVLWAVENMVTAGLNDKTFAPENTVTRAETVTFLYRANK